MKVAIIEGDLVVLIKRLRRGVIVPPESSGTIDSIEIFDQITLKLVKDIRAELLFIIKILYDLSNKTSTVLIIHE